MKIDLLETLKSPRFWAVVLAIVFVVLTTYVPAVAAKIDQTAVINVVIAIVAFIAAESLQPGPIYAAIFGSLRFWSLLVSLAFIFLKAFVPTFPLNEDMIQALVAAFSVGSIGAAIRPVGQTK
jgi:hypothetical protein